MGVKLEVDLTDALMGWQDEFLVPSAERHSTYYLDVPRSWASLPPEELRDRVFRVFTAMYDEFNAGFREAEPDDMSYLAPLDVAPRVLGQAEVESAPWRAARTPSAWESTPCVVVDEQGKYTKVDRSAF